MKKTEVVLHITWSPGLAKTIDAELHSWERKEDRQPEEEVVKQHILHWTYHLPSSLDWSNA